MSERIEREAARVLCRGIAELVGGVPVGDLVQDECGMNATTIMTIWMTCESIALVMRPPHLLEFELDGGGERGAIRPRWPSCVP